MVISGDHAFETKLSVISIELGGANICVKKTNAVSRSIAINPPTSRELLQGSKKPCRIGRRGFPSGLFLCSIDDDLGQGKGEGEDDVSGMAFFAQEVAGFAMQLV